MSPTATPVRTATPAAPSPAAHVPAPSEPPAAADPSSPGADATAVRPSLPLASRPRRPRVQREPTLRAAARSVRRTAPRTTTSAWRRASLPGPTVATAGARPAEVAASLLVVGLLFVPLAVWTRAAPGAFVVLGFAVAAVAYAAWARRVVVGADFVAVRRLGRYHVASADHVRHLELRAMQGGTLWLHTDDGRTMSLRRIELEADGVAAGLKELAGCGSSTRDLRVCALLGLAEEEGRVLDRYRPAMATA